jgi:hypothetical protein
MLSRINADPTLSKAQAHAVEATIEWTEWLKTATKESLEAGARVLFEEGYRAALAAREDTERPEERREQMPNPTDYHGGGVMRVRDTERPGLRESDLTHNASHRVERSTSGMSARCLDCDWTYEYD